MLTLSDIKLAVIGLGYVGLPLAVEFAKQRNVLGFDVAHARISRVEACLKLPSPFTLDTHFI